MENKDEQIQIVIDEIRKIPTRVETCDKKYLGYVTSESAKKIAVAAISAYKESQTVNLKGEITDSEKADLVIRVIGIMENFQDREGWHRVLHHSFYQRVAMQIIDLLAEHFYSKALALQEEKVREILRECEEESVMYPQGHVIGVIVRRVNIDKAVSAICKE